MLCLGWSVGKGSSYVGSFVCTPIRRFRPLSPYPNGPEPIVGIQLKRIVEPHTRAVLMSRQ